MADTPLPRVNDFRVVGGKYLHNNEEVSQEEYGRRQAAADKAIKDFKEAPTPGFEDLEADMRGFKERAAARRQAAGKKAGGTVKSASSRGDGIAQRGKTKGRMV
jgi:hypothetical protein